MCGIVGLVHADTAWPVDRRRIERMCAAIRHRGPDDEGLYVRGAVGLGMRRLSIIDLAGGRQPIFNEDGSKVIVFNGEIYNYRTLRAELAARGHRFATRGDTETVVHLYEELGTRCVERLRGMFAFAIWDHATRTLTLARDRFGIKPLYVATGPWGIAFASELKALCAGGLAGDALDWEALDGFLQLGYVPAPATPFRDVRKVEPGHVFVWRPGSGGSSRRYWDVPVDQSADGHDAPQRVREALDDAVAAHLVSDVPVAAFLSGGLDSSAVVASTAQLGYNTHAFTVRYGGSGAAATDETALARKLARRWGVPLTVVDVQPDMADDLEAIVYALDEPHADDSALPAWRLSRAVADGYKVALTGIGGDELFGGYRRHAGLVAGERYGRLPRRVRTLLGRSVGLLPEPRGGGLSVDRLKRFLQADGAAPPERWLDYISRARDGDRRALYRPGLGRAISGSAARARFRALWRQAGSPEGLGGALYFDYKTFLADDVLALSDRLSMAHSLEIRVPLVDHELVGGVLPLTTRFGLSVRRAKPLLWSAVGGRLSRAHARAPKRGFVGPTSSWLRHELREMLCDELSAARLGRLGYFNPAAVQRLLDEHLSRRRNREGILWALLCFSVWHRLYVETPGARTTQWDRAVRLPQDTAVVSLP
jgi:asparagine synthase (glutamine-hydrolysing)